MKHTPAEVQQFYRELAEQAELVTALIQQRDALRTALEELRETVYQHVDGCTDHWAELTCRLGQAQTALALPDPDAGDTAR